MALSSINFQKVSTHSFKHNDRTEERTAKTVHTEYSHKNICDSDSKSAAQNFNELFNESIAKVTGRERRADKKNTLVEAVVNIKPNTTLEDLKELQKHIEKEFGFTGLQIAIHKDEGHYEDGKFITNDHAHLSFFTLDKENGRQMFRREHISRDKLRDLQTETAKILNMDRGKSKEETGRERLSHKDFKQSKKLESEKIKELLATKDQLKEANNQLRSFMKDNGANRQDYAELERTKKELEEKLKAKELTEKELLTKFQELETNFKKEKGHLESVIEVKEIDIIDLKNQNKSLQEQKTVLNDKLVELEKKNDSRSNMSDLEVNKQLQKIVNDEIEEKEIKTGLFSSEKAPVIKNHKSFFEKIKDLALKGAETVAKEFLELKTKYSDLVFKFNAVTKENAELKAKVKTLESERSSAPKQQKENAMESIKNLMSETNEKKGEKSLKEFLEKKAKEKEVKSTRNFRDR